jgi:hypothetical protein
MGKRTRRGLLLEAALHCVGRSHAPTAGQALTAYLCTWLCCSWINIQLWVALYIIWVIPVRIVSALVCLRVSSSYFLGPSRAASYAVACCARRACCGVLCRGVTHDEKGGTPTTVAHTQSHTRLPHTLCSLPPHSGVSKSSHLLRRPSADTELTRENP